MQVEKQDCVPIYSGFNFTTTVVLPPGEEIKDFVAGDGGDKGFWGVDRYDNTVSVKPKLIVKLSHKKIDPTNVNVIAASGNVYCVVATEVSGTDQPIDLKVILEQKDPQALANIEHPEWVRADYARELEKALALSKEEGSQSAHTAAYSEAKSITHDYEWKGGKEAEAFGLRAVYHDTRFTYIEAHSQNAPVLYEIGSDGKEHVIQYDLENGKYVVQHVMDHGMLKAGKKKIEFARVKETV